MTRRKVTTALAHKKATVGIQRNGLTIEVQDVQAEDAGLVARELLEVVRTLVKMGYEEVILDAGSFHGHPMDQLEEVDGEDGTVPPNAHPRKRVVGF